MKQSREKREASSGSQPGRTLTPRAFPRAEGVRRVEGEAPVVDGSGRRGHHLGDYRIGSDAQAAAGPSVRGPAGPGAVDRPAPAAEEAIQRLIGFEMEYQVPTYGKGVGGVTYKGGENTGGGEKQPNAWLDHFLFGGLAYGTAIGGSSDPGKDSFRVTSDHKGAVSREPVRAKLASMGKLDPADTKDSDASSNLEYVTSPVDELSKGADKKLAVILDAVATHAADTLTKAQGDRLSRMASPGNQAATGTGTAYIKDWLSNEDFQLVKPELDSLKNNIKDSFYLQATVGIVLSAVGELMEKGKESDGLHLTGGKFDQIYAAIDSVTKAVAAKVKKHDYIKGLLESKDMVVLGAVSGMLRLLAMYLVGEALTQTAAHPGGHIKNAVPFLSKVDPVQYASAGPAGMSLFDAVPDGFVTEVADALAQCKEITIQYWRDLGYQDRVVPKDQWFTAGSVKNLTTLFLQGKKPKSTAAQTGAPLKKTDEMPEMEEFIGGSEHQRGIPLEFRYIKARPQASGLKAELLKIVEQVREVNLSQVSDKRRAAIEKQVKE